MEITIRLNWNLFITLVMTVVYRIEDELADLKLLLRVNEQEHVIGWQQKLTGKVSTLTAGEIDDPATCMYVLFGDTKLVCLKAYPCGRLECTPGFSRLVRLPQCEYIVENASKVPDWAEEDEVRRVEVRAKPYEFDVGLVLQLESALNFDCDWIFLEYEVHLPRGWRGVDGDWTTTDDGASMCAGCTQLSQVGGESDFTGWILAGGLFFGLLIGPSYALGVIFGAVLLVWSYGGQTQSDGMAHFNHPIVMHLKKDHDAPLSQAPCLYLHASSRRSFDRCVVEGYTHWRLPTTSSQVNVDLRTWRPLNGIRDQVQDFFIGGAHRLADLRYARYAPDDYDTKPRAFNSKYGFLAQTSGTIRLSGRVVVPPTTTKEAPTSPQEEEEVPVMEKSRGRKIIDNILANLRASLKTGDLEWDPDESRLARDRALELIQKLRAERRDIRNYVMGVGVDDLQGHPETKGDE